MNKLKIRAKTRTLLGKKVKNLRKQGELPVVMYGHGVEPQALSVDAKEFGKVYKEGGSSTMIEVFIDDNKEPLNVLFTQVDVDPVTDELLHADFQQVKTTEKIKAEIPVLIHGSEDAPVVKELEGSIITNKDRIEVQAYPQDLPPEIKVDVSGLSSFEDIIYLKDLDIPQNVEVLDDADSIIVSVQEPRSEEELAELDEEIKEDVESVEVEEKGAAEEDSEGEEGEKPKEEGEPEGKDKKEDVKEGKES